MNSIRFPDMFDSAKTNVVDMHDATLQNLKLVLKSTKKSFFGDPYFGTNIQRMLHDENNIVLQDLVIDDIYSAILTFMPQIKISRKNIEVVSEFDKLFVRIKCINLLDYSTNMYEINLMEEE